MLKFVQVDHSYTERQKSAGNSFAKDVEYIVTTYVAEDKSQVVVGSIIADSDAILDKIDVSTFLWRNFQTKLCIDRNKIHGVYQ